MATTKYMELLGACVAVNDLPNSDENISIWVNDPSNATQAADMWGRMG